VSCKCNSDDFPFFKGKIGPPQPQTSLNQKLTYLRPGKEGLKPFQIEMVT
jgi:hypothetical protein